MALPIKTVPIFIIALNGGSRSDTLCRQLTQLDIPFEIINAIEGSALDQTALEEIYDERNAIRRVGRPMSPGEIGCALSHRSIYRLMAERGIAIALILEEDAILGPQFKSLWQTASALPADVDILLLYSEAGFVRRHPSATLAECGLHQATLMLSHAVGYILRLACAEAILRRTEHIDMVADWPLDHREMRQFLAIPMPVGHNYVDSTINPDRPNKNLLGQFQAPPWFSALVYLTYAGYLLQPGRYEGLANYYRREVARRLKRLFSPAEINVGTLPAPQIMNGQI